MITVQIPMPLGLVRFHRANGAPLEIPAGATADITFQRVVHPLESLPEIPNDTPECVRINHRFRDAVGEEFVFTSHVRAEFLWNQLYEREAYVDYHAMLERELPATLPPWRETVIIESIRGSDDLRDFRAFRVHRPEERGHPDVVPIFSKHLTWTARVTLVSADMEPSIGGTAYAFVSSFVNAPGLTALRDVAPDGDGPTWKAFDLEPPFHVCIRAGDLLWRYFDEPDETNWWRSMKKPVMCQAVEA
jgi:hypothetical protein